MFLWKYSRPKPQLRVCKRATVLALSCTTFGIVEWRFLPLYFAR